MTEIGSHADPVSFRNEQSPILPVEVAGAESPVSRIVVGKVHVLMAPIRVEIIPKRMQKFCRISAALRQASERGSGILSVSDDSE